MIAPDRQPAAYRIDRIDPRSGGVEEAGGVILAIRLRAPPNATPGTAPPSIAARHVRILSADGEAITDRPNVTVTVAKRLGTAVVADTDANADAGTIEIDVHIAGLPSVPVLADPPVWYLQLVDVPGLDPGRSWCGFIADLPVAPVAPARASPSATQAPARALVGTTAIDYLARDFDALTAMMIGRLTAHLPPDAAARLNAPADPLRTIVEVLAAAGDYLSYYQDAVATEAALDSARWRLSVRRHARLLDYRLDDGCNARTWLAIEIEADAFLPAGTCAVSTQSVAIHPQLPTDFALAPGTIGFQTMTPCRMFADLNDLGTALQRPQAYVLPQGSWSATLRGVHPELVPGRVLVFEQLQDVGDVPAFGAHAVRICHVGQLPAEAGAIPAPSSAADALPPVATFIAWHPQDALPRALTIPAAANGGVSLYGNCVLADHGLPTTAGPLGSTVGPDGETCLTLRTDDVTFATPPPLVPAFTAPVDPLRSFAAMPSACGSLCQELARVAPQIALLDDTGARWTSVSDLLDANALSRSFVAEIGPGFGEPSDRPETLFLRFGDGVLGRMPDGGAVFEPSWRRGNGPQGNINAGVLTQLLVDPVIRIAAFRSPLPAVGGAAAAPTRYGKLMASTAYRRQRRGVTPGDLTMLAMEHPLVTDAATEIVAGDAHGFRVWIQATHPRPLSLAVVRSHMTRFEIANAPVEVDLAVPVGVEIALTVYVERADDVATVRARLARNFGNGLAMDGTPAFFNPAKWRLGEPLLLFDLVAAMLADSRIARVDTDRTDPRIRFALWPRDGSAPVSGLGDGSLVPGPGEVLQALNDPNVPASGSVVFYVTVAS